MSFFLKICELAFDMTCSSKQVFEVDKLSFFYDTGSDVPFLGLVTVDSSAGTKICTLLFISHFKSILQHTMHVSKMEEEAQMKVLRVYGKEKNMQVVWKFYCGLASFSNQDLRFMEVLKGHDDSLFHCKCAFESQQLNTCKCVVLFDERKGLCFKDQSLNASDFVSINYVIENTASVFLQLSISGCTTGTLDNLTALAGNLKLCNYLQYLSFSESEVGDEGMEILANCLVKLSQLQTLNFSRNEIGSDGMKAIAHGLKNCKSLRTLEIEGDFDPLSQIAW